METFMEDKLHFKKLLKTETVFLLIRGFILFLKCK